MYDMCTGYLGVFLHQKQSHACFGVILPKTITHNLASD